MRPDSVMLFAAGFGTRMGDLTATRPKPLIEVAGKPLIDHALELVEGINPRQTVVNAHYLPDQIRAHLADRDVAVSHEPKILETGGGLRAALPLLGAGPVFTMNTDAVWHGPNPLKILGQVWAPDRMDALLLCIPRANAVGHTGQGDFLMAADGRLTRGPGQVYSGIQIVKTALLDEIEEDAFSLNLLWNRMLDMQRLFGVSYPGHWCDVGRPEGIQLAEKMIGFGDV